jgi:glycosyltransferase involved in cell wall biosynthesis
MKIALVHNTYQHPGGEDVVFEQEKQMLEDAGHEVVTYCRSNDEIPGLSSLSRLILPIRITWASDTKHEFERLLHREKPDLVHIHNTFMMVSPSIYSACRECRVPVIQTLHNFRLLCPASGFFRDAGPCEECVDHGLLRSVRYGCYRSSRAATAAVAAMLASHRVLGTWTRSIDRYIALNNFSREKFVSAGLPSEKVTVKPNFVSPDPGAGDNRRDYAVFVGRASLEKGIFTLVEAWTGFGISYPLQIVGDAPDRAVLETEARKRGVSSITFRGQLGHSDAVAAIKNARLLIMPSVSYETFGMSIVEAFACGTPVVCSRLGGMQELVKHQLTGLHFTPGDAGDLAETVRWALDHPSRLAEMGRAGRREFEMHYTAKANYSRLMEIYEQAITAYAAQGHLSERRKTANGKCYDRASAGT